MFFPRQLTFEEQQIAREESEAFQQLVAAKVAQLGEDPSIEDFAAAVNDASIEMDPDDGELKYELDEGAERNR